MKATKTTKPKAPLPPCPRADKINVIQYQLFDNGPTPGKGKSQHVLGIEVYCDGRLDLYRPYWKRAVPLLDPKKFMTWVDDALAKDVISAAQHVTYKMMADEAAKMFASGGFEFAKLGHLGSNDRGTTRYPGQFVTVMKAEGGGLHVILLLNDDPIHTDSFQYNRAWHPGARSRKFWGFHDPFGMYADMKAEQAMKAEAEARRGQL